MAGTKRAQSVEAKARKQRSSCIIKDERITLSNMRDRNFPRFSYYCNGESFTPGLPDDEGSPARREKEPHTFAKLDVEKKLDA